MSVTLTFSRAVPNNLIPGGAPLTDGSAARTEILTPGTDPAVSSVVAADENLAWATADADSRIAFGEGVSAAALDSDSGGDWHLLKADTPRPFFVKPGWRAAAETV